MRKMLRRAMQQSDDLVVVVDYTDSKGKASRRVISPIRFLAADRILALCLCREEPRQFYLSRCRNVRLDRAADYLMPLPLIEPIGA